MTQTAERTVPYEVYERELQRRKQAEKAANEQKSLNDALRNEVRWLEEVIFHPGLNEVDIRLLAINTPPEMRMGVITQAPEHNIYLPKIAEDAHCSEKTASRRLRRLASGGAFSYHAAPDPETGNTRVRLAPLPAAETPAQIDLSEADRGGGSTWKDGKRIKRCSSPTCGSENLVEVTERRTICADCGTEQPNSYKKTIKPVNDPHGHGDIEPPADEEEQMEMEAHSQSDAEPESSNVRPTVYTCGGITELSRPPRWLRRKKVWCPWRYEEPEKPRADGKLDKVPYQTRGRVPQKASVSKPATWATYEQAWAFYEQSVQEGWKRPFDGIGFMCDGSFVGIDLDHCRNKETGEIAAWAQAIIDRFPGAYLYVTPSREGLRIVIGGKKPGSHCKKGNTEIYEDGRFFTWTPEQLAGTPDELVDGQAALEVLYKEVWPEPEKSEDKGTTVLPLPSLLPDETILEKASNARNGAKFRRLWQGDTTGYPSQSEADQALCEMLSYYGGGGDVSTIERLFQQSRLYRKERWYEPARAGETYGEGTMKRAIQMAGWQVAS